MAQNFTGEVKARGVNGTLMSEAATSATAKGPQISARFKIEAGQKAKDERGKPLDVGGTELTWYTTLTDKTRQRTIDSLVHTGLRRKVAEQFVEMVEAANHGKVPLAAGFGSKVCSLTLELNNKGKTRVEWVNPPEGGRASKAENAPELKLDPNVADDDDDAGGADDDEAPWNRA